MEKKLEDYLHLYKKVPIAIFDGGEPVSHYLEGFDWNSPGKEVISERVGWDYSKIKPILRPLDSMTNDEWTEIASLLLDATPDGLKHEGYALLAISSKEVKYAFLVREEKVKGKEVEEIDVNQLLRDAEVENYEHVICMSKDGNAFYSQEDCFPLYLKEQMLYINWLRNNFFDVDGLIEAGLAIDKTKLPLEQNG